MQDKTELTLMAVGDVFISRPLPLSNFAALRPVLKQADILLGNQEGPLTDRGQPLVGKVELGSWCKRGNPAGIEAEAAAGFSCMTLANNHIMDYGAAGMLHTMEMLRKHGIAYAGAGGSLEEARQPAFLRRNGARIALLGYTCVFPPMGYAAGKDVPGVATVKVHTAYQAPHNVPYQPGTPPIVVTIPDQEQLAAMLADVRGARRGADLVVVQFHWGVAGFPRVMGYMKEMARAAIDAGADLILGHHPHLLLGFERYKEGLICYSLNEFCYDGDHAWPEVLDSVILKAGIRGGRMERFSVIPLVTVEEETRNTVVPAGDRREAIRRSLEGLSQEFHTTFSASGDELVMTGPPAGAPPPRRAPQILSDPLLTFPKGRTREYKYRDPSQGGWVAT